MTHALKVKTIREATGNNILVIQKPFQILSEINTKRQFWKSKSTVAAFSSASMLRPLQPAATFVNAHHHARKPEQESVRLAVLRLRQGAGPSAQRQHGTKVGSVPQGECKSMTKNAPAVSNRGVFIFTKPSLTLSRALR
ncbi:MAG: hypothetical protein JXR35_10460 [Rhodobacteraceae bacterium]|nr:hypothetical protein [Paracoccaceae bacterium]